MALNRADDSLLALPCICANQCQAFLQRNLCLSIAQVEEGWVQCDRCEGWVHQICGLFNKGRNNEDAGYLCPHCLLHGERPQDCFAFVSDD